MKHIWTLVLLAIISGCASAGRPIDLAALQKLEKGISTQNDVRAAMGAPMSAGIIPDGKSYFMYIFSRSQIKAESMIPIVGLFAGGSKTDIQTLQIWFDENGVMENYLFNESQQDISQGLLSQ